VADKDIPVCTLKTFPHKAEHCVAWSKILFDTVFDADIRLLKTILSSSNKDLASLLESDELLEDGVARRLLNNLLWPNYTTLVSHATQRLQGVTQKDVQMMHGAMLNALLLFHEVFCREIVKLIEEHPEGSLEGGDTDQKILFWGRGRIFPKGTRFNKKSITHKQFILHAARIMCRGYGFNYSYEIFERIFDSSIGELLAALPPDDIPLDMSAVLFGSVEVEVPSRTPQQYTQMLLRILSEKYSINQSPTQPFNLAPEFFLKDADDAGHVEFCTAAANIRSSIYGIPPIDKLSVRQIVGNIIPALSTTTAVVSGLVGQELVKVAAEKDACNKSFSSLQSLSDRGHGEKVGLRDRLYSFGSRLRGFLPLKSVVKPTPDGLLQNKNRVLQNKNRVLGRFRNNFVDLDGPAVAQSEPAAAEQFIISSSKLKGEHESKRSFNLWDVIRVPHKDTKNLTIKNIKEYLLHQFGVDVVSFISEDGSLLYAKYLPQFSNNALDSLTVHDLVVLSSTDAADIATKQLWNIDLQVYCEDIIDGHEVHLPRIRVPVRRA